MISSSEKSGEPPSSAGVRAACRCSIVLAAIACRSPAEGQLEAEAFGTLLEPPAVRVEKATGRAQVCGPAIPTHDSIERGPYLHLTNDTGATVVWTASGSAPATVSVSPSSGGDAISFEPTVAPTTFLTHARQLEASLEALSPSTTYCYSLRDPTGTTLAGPYSLRTAPRPGADDPVQIVVLGDSGTGSPYQAAVAAQLSTVDADFFLHTGDVAYESGTLPQLEQTYFDMYAPLISSAPAYLAPGNHDYETAGGAPFREVFVLPDNGGLEGRERWYSFDWGPVHVVVLDSQSSLAPQSAWLNQDLSDTTLPWKIVVTHWGPYSSGKHGSNSEFRRTFRPLLESHGVHLVLSGHDHHYERSKPIGRITYVVTGGGGSATRQVDHSEWSAFGVGVLHFVYVDVRGNSMRVHAIDGTGEEFDGVHIRRDRRY